MLNVIIGFMAVWFLVSMGWLVIRQSMSKEVGGFVKVMTIGFATAVVSTAVYLFI